MKFENTECGQIIKQAGDVFNKKQLTALFAGLDDTFDEAAMAKAVKSAVDTYSKTAEYFALKNKRDLIFNSMRQSEVMSIATKSKDSLHAVKSLLLGGEGRGTGERGSVANYSEAMHKQLQSELDQMLNSKQLRKLYRSGELDQEIMRGMEKLSSSSERWATRSYADKPIRDEAMQIAKFLHDQQERIRQSLNLDGAFISNRDGFIISQTHDQFKIAHASGEYGKVGQMLDRGMKPKDFATWRDKVMPLIDFEGTRQNLIKSERLGVDAKLDPEKLMKSLYEVFTTKIRKSAGSVDGVGNYADKMSQARVIEFRDADAFHAYNKEFGGGTLAETYDHYVKNSSRNKAVLRVLGPNAKENLQKVVNDLALQARDSGDLAKADRIKKGSRSIEDAWRHVSGENSAPENYTLSQIRDFTLGINRVSQLGSAVIASFTDLFTVAMHSEMAGVPIGKSAVMPFIHAFADAANPETRAFLRRQGVGLEGFMSSAASRWDGMGKGSMKKMQDWFFKATGLTQWTDHLKSGAVFTLSNEIAENMGKAFKSLDRELQMTLGDYRISSSEWDAIRSLKHEEVRGYKVLGSDAVRDMPRERVEVLLKADGITPTERAVASRLEDLEIKMRELYTDFADYAVNTPDARTQAMMRGNGMIRHNSTLGIMSSMALQYKAFTVSLTHKFFGRAYQTHGVMGIAGAAAGLSMFGTAAYMIKQALNGKSYDVRNMDAEQWGNLFMQGSAYGGGLGIVSDLLSSQQNTSLLDVLGGPSSGIVTKPIKIGKSLIKGDTGKAAEDTIKYGRSLVPGNNIWWLKPFIDYGIMYHLQEAVNPGSLERMQKRAKKDGQQFMLEPQ